MTDAPQRQLSVAICAFHLKQALPHPGLGGAQVNAQARLTRERAFASGRICLKNGWKACYFLLAMIFGGLASTSAIFAPALATLYLIRITRPEDVNNLRLGEPIAQILLLAPLGLQLAFDIILAVPESLCQYRLHSRDWSDAGLLGSCVGSGLRNFVIMLSNHDIILELLVLLFVALCWKSTVMHTFPIL
ncbi:hypothetical protein SCLCIDRAFT_840361 [Scleroderma citrinum Foug A]|uniref:Uncharacterized protein n=1 Tax=Scleroderma citrinum Foug A TaxID=1036808 RepID=A0A0C2ZKZ0_9AGAM|nr:hypothetical protein SCLCIDRAFT_840361 [Scleroderma citrinum Foug A]